MQLLFAVVTVICVSLAIGVLLPGVGVVLGLVFVPAVIRAAAAIRRKEEAGLLKDRSSQVVAAVFVSAGITFVVWLASAVAFTIVCFPLGWLSFGIETGGGIGMILGFVLGGLAGLAVFYWFMRRFWPRPTESDDATA